MHVRHKNKSRQWLLSDKMFPSDYKLYKQIIKTMLVSIRSIVLLINCEFDISFALQVSKINPIMLVGGGEFTVSVNAPVLTFSLHVKYKNSKKKPGKRQIIRTINNTLQSLTITWCSHVLSGFVTAQDLFTWCVCCNSNFFSKRVPQRGDNLLTRFHIYDTFLIKLFAVEYPTTIFYYWIYNFKARSFYCVYHYDRVWLRFCVKYLQKLCWFYSIL